MDQELPERALASQDMPHGNTDVASALEWELVHPGVDLGMSHESLESSQLRHASAGRGPREDHPERGLGLVIIPDTESGSSEAGDSH